MARRSTRRWNVRSSSFAASCELQFYDVHASCDRSATCRHAFRQGRQAGTGGRRDDENDDDDDNDCAHQRILGERCRRRAGRIRTRSVERAFQRRQRGHTSPSMRWDIRRRCRPHRHACRRRRAGFFVVVVVVVVVVGFFLPYVRHRFARDGWQRLRTRCNVRDSACCCSRRKNNFSLCAASRVCVCVCVCFCVSHVPAHVLFRVGRRRSAGKRRTAGWGVGRRCR